MAKNTIEDFEDAIESCGLMVGKPKDRDLAIASHFYSKGRDFKITGKKDPIVDFIGAGAKMGYFVDKAEMRREGNQDVLELRLPIKTAGKDLQVQVTGESE